MTKITNKTKKEFKEKVLNHKKCAESDLTNQLRAGDEEFFDLKEVEFPFGKRKVFYKKSQDTYELLQGTRSSAVPKENKDFDELVSLSKSFLEKIDEHDLVRIDELNNIRKALKNSTGKDLGDFKSIVEIGFRTPRLLKYYLGEGFKEAWGCDVLMENVVAAQALGYNAFVYDLDECHEDLDLKESDLVVSYHVLEHVSNPHKAIKKIYQSMKKESYFHVEIPIEPGVPNIRYCHLFPFHPGDLLWMLKDAGFEPLTFSNVTHEGGPWVERILCKKGS